MRGYGYDESECLNITGCQWMRPVALPASAGPRSAPTRAVVDPAGVVCSLKTAPAARVGAVKLLRAHAARARALLNTYPEDAAFCPSWAKYRICSHYWNQDQCTAAAECEYDANNGMCTPVYTTSDFNFTQLQDSYQHYDFGSSVCTGTSAESCDSEGCRWVADGGTGYPPCRLTLDGKKQQLADDNIPDAVAGWILTGHGNIDFECPGRDQTSCDDRHPLCSFLRL